MNLSTEELERYERQLILKNWGEKQQLCLKKTSLAIPSSLKLAARYALAAGCGQVYLVGEISKKDLLELKELNPNSKVHSTKNLSLNVDIIINHQDSLSFSSRNNLFLEISLDEGEKQIVSIKQSNPSFRINTPEHITPSPKFLCLEIAQSIAVAIMLKWVKHCSDLS